MKKYKRKHESRCLSNETLFLVNVISLCGFKFLQSIAFFALLTLLEHKDALLAAEREIQMHY